MVEGEPVLRLDRDGNRERMPRDSQPRDIYSGEGADSALEMWREIERNRCRWGPVEERPAA